MNFIKKGKTRLKYISTEGEEKFQKFSKNYLQSSILSAVIIIVNVTLAISFTLLIRYLGFDEIAIPVCRAIVIVHLSVQMPLILWLTIKNQRKNKNNKPKPPHGLQFHGVSFAYLTI